MPLTLAALSHAVAQDAALRRRRRLQPVGGQGDKLFPPTYPGENKNDPPRHVFERRRIGETEVWCVLLDSVQSQANRMEEALLQAARDGRLDLPRLSVDFTAAEGLEMLGEISSLDAPHRVFDAILRDSLLGDEPFKDSDVGKALKMATARDASAILEVSPSALLFGAWNSTGEGGGLGAKFARAIVSEIVAIGVPVEQSPQYGRAAEPEARSAGRRTGSRIDPLGTSKTVPIYHSAENPSDWTHDPDEALKNDKGEPELFKRKTEAGKAGTPAHINHGNIPPSIQPLGITCDYAEQTVVLTFAGLRRLRFGGPNTKEGADRDAAGRTLIAALGLVALLEQDAQGYALRSRCDLVCDGPAPLEVVHADGTTEHITLTRDDTLALYGEALAAARKAGFTFPAEPVRLTPQDKLAHIVRESMHKALAGEGHSDEGE